MQHETAVRRGSDNFKADNKQKTAKSRQRLRELKIILKKGTKKNNKNKK